MKVCKKDLLLIQKDFKNKLKELENLAGPIRSELEIINRELSILELKEKALDDSNPMHSFGYGRGDD